MPEQWFLWAVNDDPRTNEYLADLIGHQYPDAEHHNISCADNARRNLWECHQGYRQVRSAIAASTTYRLRFEVFRKTGDGPVVQWNLWKPELKRRARHTRQRRMIKKAS